MIYRKKERKKASIAHVYSSIMLAINSCWMLVNVSAAYVRNEKWLSLRASSKIEAAPAGTAEIPKVNRSTFVKPRNFRQINSNKDCKAGWTRTLN